MNENQSTEHPPLVHVHGQQSFHDSAILIGNRQGLMQLQEILTEVLASEQGSAAREVYTTDGEGYDLQVIIDESRLEDSSWARAELPYQHQAAEDTRDNRIPPYMHQPFVKKS
jgi:hypothetical protein